MRIVSSSILFVVAGCISCGAHAAVYKCTNALGAVAFQDHACTKGDAETKVHFGTDPPEKPAAEATVDESKPVLDPPPVAPAEPGPVPAMWACLRAEDGTQYVSRDGNPQPRMVPAGVLGVGSKSLAQTYGPGGVGVSAPSMRQIPVDKSPQSAVSGDYIAVQDQCEPMSREQTCGYLQKQYDDVHQKLKRAFKDEQAILQPQEDKLSDDLSGC